LSRPTIRKLLALSAPPWQEPPESTGALVSSGLRPFLPYLQRRWVEGASMSLLLRELHARGDHGSWSTLWRALHTWPRPEPATTTAPSPPSTPAVRPSRRDRRWLLLRSPAQLTPAEKAALERLLDADPVLARAHRLLQDFRSLFTSGNVADLDRWLDDADQHGPPAFVSLAHGIRDDREAVNGALTTRWSAGPTEGRICKIKLQKRLGYGRAAFDLLRKRVLAAS
jgi:transposase